MYLTVSEFLKYLRQYPQLKGALHRDAAQNLIELAASRLNNNLAQLYTTPFDMSSLPTETQAILRRLTFYLALRELGTQIDLQVGGETESAIVLTEFEAEFNRVITGEFILVGAPRRRRVLIGGYR